MIKLCVRRRFYQARQDCHMKSVHSTFERIFSFDFTASENSNEAHTQRIFKHNFSSTNMICVYCKGKKS